MTKLAIAAIAAAALVLPSTAVAKGAMSATVCGSSGCSEVTDPDQLMYLAESGVPVEAPAKRSEWYRATVTVGGHGYSERFTIAIVPGLRLIRGLDEQAGTYTWTPVDDQAAAALEEVTAGLEPFAADSLKGTRAQPPAPEPSGAHADAGLPGWALPATLLALAAAALGLGLARARHAPRLR
jgi:hypothetical protein